MYPIIRLERIELNDFKNVKQGMIENTEYRNKLFYTNKADIIGIYGQNGSGKTSVVEALHLLKLLMSGEVLPKEFKNYINQEASDARIKFTLYLEEPGAEQKENTRYLIYYEFVIGLEESTLIREKKKAYIKSEILSYSVIGIRGKTELIHYEADEQKEAFTPKVRFQEVAKKKPQAAITVEVVRRMARMEGKSFIFHSDIMGLFQLEDGNPEYARILQVLNYYAKMNLFVITNRNQETYQLMYMPISFRLTMEDVVRSGVVPISLSGPTYVKSSSYELARLVLQQLNLVVGAILPGMHIEITELGKEINRENEELRQIELVSVRNLVKVPIKYESEGIKKILSILSTLISVYNNPSVCLVVDELDSGVFEYLLGELLQIMERHAKGQLMFTSHNLRALEKLHKDSIIISTANPSRRFVRFPHEKQHKNFRNSYLRSIDLGGLEEEVYVGNNSYEISYAFRKAGELFESE